MVSSTWSKCGSAMLDSLMALMLGTSRSRSHIDTEMFTPLSGE